MRILFIAALILVVLLCATECGRGGRSSRSGVRSRSRSSSRIRSSRSSRYSDYSKAIAAGLVVSGLTRYRRRYYETRHYSSDPNICFTKKSGTFDNGTYTKSLGYFICPYSESDSYSDTYCCGDSDSQKCCGYWDNGGRVAGAVIGIILAVILTVVVVILVIRCFCCTTTPEAVGEPESPALYSKMQREDQAQPPVPSEQFYPPATQENPYPPMPQPTSYPPMPQPDNDTPEYIPGQAPYPPNTGPLPYPQNPGPDSSPPPPYSEKFGPDNPTSTH